MTTLYKKDSKGKIRILNIYTEGAELVQEAGLLEGSLVMNRKVCKPKNEGRSNATTPEEQAISEMESKIAEKLKEDYFRTQEEAQTIQVILPMLAKDYKEHNHKIDWRTAAIQPKLDGMRALGVTGPNATLTSREGSPITTMDHIIADLKRLPEGMILDGELYAHGVSFQENMKLIKKYRPDHSESVKYHVYDTIADLRFETRFRMMLYEIEQMLVDTIIPVATHFTVTSSELIDLHTLNISNGYEGTMVRWGNEGYKINGRSEHLLKYKDFRDIALPIVDIKPSDARPEWGQPVFNLNGKEFSSGLRYSHQERREFLINKDQYIGKTAEIRFFEYTHDGLPRFPVMVGIRNDK
jgi:DNA ligase-1